jgi:23S rRNA pseudouridine1911/1915/1917 synthase
VNERLVVLQYEKEGEQRLDKFLVDCLPEFSRSQLQRLIREEHVRVDGVPARKTGQTLEAGAVIQVHIPAPEPSELVPEEIPLKVVFENDDILVVDKPSGMVVHPAAGHHSGTLVHAVLAYAPEIEGVGGVRRPGIVHRLDKDTSGLILMAKNGRAHRWLGKQFRKRQVSKAYLALVDGHPPTPKGRVEAPIGRHPVQRKRMAVTSSQKGRESVSEYHSLERFKEHTLLEVHPITGRTHQIRVHMAFLGTPVVGDTVYGRKHPSLPLERQFLHAARLTISIPNEVTQRTFEAPLPEELAKVLEALRASTGD